MLDQKWQEILGVLPDTTLQALLALPDDEVEPIKLYQILEESGIDLNAIFTNKEANGEV